MSNIKIKLEAVNAPMSPLGEVAFLKMPIDLHAFESLNKFVEIAYGDGCVCSEDPKGWMCVRTPKDGSSGRHTTAPCCGLAASELYPYSDTPRIEFLKKLDTLASTADALLKESEEDIEFEMVTIKLCSELRSLASYLGTSPQHDELISVYLLLMDSTKNQILDSCRARALRDSFKLIRTRANVTDDVLDSVKDILEAAGFDLGIPMQGDAIGACIELLNAKVRVSE